MRKEYRQIRYAERKEIEQMLKAGRPITEISDTLGYSRDAIYEEFKRFGMTRQNYSADAAQMRAIAECMGI